MNPKGVFLIGALMAVMCVSAATPAPSQSPTVIGTDRAIAIATAQAKATPTAITKLVVKRDQDDKTQVETYEIELRANGIEFDYMIAATDGAILARCKSAAPAHRSISFSVGTRSPAKTIAPASSSLPCVLHQCSPTATACWTPFHPAPHCNGTAPPPPSPRTVMRTTMREAPILIDPAKISSPACTSPTTPFACNALPASNTSAGAHFITSLFRKSIPFHPTPRPVCAAPPAAQH